MSYPKITVEPGIEVWRDWPENWVFHDHESPAFNELTEEEFSGLIKGLNIMFDVDFYDSKDQKLVEIAERFNKLIEGELCEECGKQVKANAVWMGKLLGFNTHCSH